MESSIVPARFDIFEIYRQYCDIKSMAYKLGGKVCLPDDASQNCRFSGEALNQLLKLVESRSQTRYDLSGKIFSKTENHVLACLKIPVFEEIYKLMLRLDLLKNQRHNISEDTWRQVLAFSRCVQDNLEGYDPEGDWPVLIYDFVEYTYRRGACKYESDSFCNCDDSEAQPLEDPLPGFSNVPHIKRKFCDSMQERVRSSDGHGSCSNVNISMRMKNYSAGKYVNWEESPCVSIADDCMETVKHKWPIGLFEVSMCG